MTTRLFIASTYTFFMVLISTAQSPFFPQKNTDGNWSYLDKAGKSVLKITLKLANADYYSEGLAAAKDAQTGKWGYLNLQGDWLIKPKYETAAAFIDGYAVVSTKCGGTQACYTGQAGFVSEYIGKVINKQGVVVLTDKSQQTEPANRWLLDKNLGQGVFSANAGTGYGDTRILVNFTGKKLSDKVPVGYVFYDENRKAFRVGNKYCTSAGVTVQDLSKYGMADSFDKNGFAWGTIEQSGKDNDVIYKVLFDKNNIIKFKTIINDFDNPTVIKQNKFYFYSGKDIYKYDILTQKKELVTSIPDDYLPKQDLKVDGTAEYSEKHKVRFVIKEDKVTQEPIIIGFVNAENKIFYKE